MTDSGSRAGQPEQPAAANIPAPRLPAESGGPLHGRSGPAGRSLRLGPVRSGPLPAARAGARGCRAGREPGWPRPTRVPVRLRRDRRCPAGRRAARQAHSASTLRRTWLAATDATPSKADWDALAGSSTGKLYLPGHASYDFAKELFSPQWDSLKPSGVAYCKRDSDVAACIAFVVKFKLPVRCAPAATATAAGPASTTGSILDISEMSSMKSGPTRSLSAPASTSSTSTAAWPRRARRCQAAPARRWESPGSPSAAESARWAGSTA